MRRWGWAASCQPTLSNLLKLRDDGHQTDCHHDEGDHAVAGGEVVWLGAANFYMSVMSHKIFFRVFYFAIAVAFEESFAAVFSLAAGAGELP